ncbi:hypothetical protein L195_g032969 [Trifolium pratense]|uniref:Uncharacterized protein n=1 Tax=Trifolium pratense TaxID=57577 RepID=A0A2K3LEN7_TRIPR|nr:hypothetical protein L195_g032969 [Trifolium pratense]
MGCVKRPFTGEGVKRPAKGNIWNEGSKKAPIGRVKRPDMQRPFRDNIWKKSWKKARRKATLDG